ncbi:restriction endonuclease subunit S [Fannyhessea vaginae]|jgi:possible type I restriction-modification system, S subunit|uniref:restriction endonuclease subunit S n=1 Tax=Fannyhessea vaginae TaxID=82135 RepID=UPI0023F03DC1|nr:restriction endonuclease subunit S [Fannyhessea vaginae]
MRKAYEEYKATGIQWLPEIPKHWEILKLRQILSSFSEKNHPNMPLLSVVREKGVIIRNTENIDENHNYIPDDLTNYKLVKAGQFAMNKMKAWQGSYGVSNHDGIVSPAYFVFNFTLDIDKQFFNAAIRSKPYVSFFGQASDGIRVGQWDLSMDRMKDISFYIPPREEQEQIVRFLDWKVSSINKLIINYRHQITMLEELKQKKIDEYVIKGIHKNNTKHNDDVRWEIDYPEHWTIQRIRQCFSFRKGLSITKANLEETGIAVINYGQIHSKNNKGIGLNKSLIKHVNKSYLKTNQRCLVEKGDFIFADTSEDVEGCGNCAYIDWHDNIFAGYHTIIAHPNRSTNSEYLAYLFSSPTWRCQIRKNVNGVKVYSITQRILKDMFILIPPIEEQKDIVNHLDSMCSEIDLIVKNVDKKITDLHDLKSSLIADVVTGQIDVRDVEIPDYEQVAESLYEADDNATLHSEDEIPEEV